MPEKNRQSSCKKACWHSDASHQGSSSSKRGATIGCRLFGLKASGKQSDSRWGNYYYEAACCLSSLSKSKIFVRYFVNCGLFANKGSHSTLGLACQLPKEIQNCFPWCSLQSPSKSFWPSWWRHPTIHMCHCEFKKLNVFRKDCGDNCFHYYLLLIRAQQRHFALVSATGFLSTFIL